MFVMVTKFQKQDGFRTDGTVSDKALYGKFNIFRFLMEIAKM